MGLFIADRDQVVLDPDEVSDAGAASQVIRMRPDAKYPPADGSLLTNIAISGSVAQVLSSVTGSVVTLSTAIPYDDTIPQSSEGTQVASVTLTPASAASKFLIFAFSQLGSSGQFLAMALFRDSTAGAIAVANVSVPVAGDVTVNMSLVHLVTAGSTSSTTFKLRIGPHSGTAFLNGTSGGVRNYGGALVSGLIVAEVRP